MISVIQRVSRAKVEVAGRVVGEIARGLMVLTAVHAADTDEDLVRTVEKVLTLRVFPNGEKSYDLEVGQVGGGVLVVPNFTVAADVTGGRRPALHPAAAPAVGLVYFEKLLGLLRARHAAVACGEFGADMAVTLSNDGPLTLVFDTRKAAK
jgi:D-tyrosyl-tRNA(Tyr) deacylase